MARNIWWRAVLRDVCIIWILTALAGFVIRVIYPEIDLIMGAAFANLIFGSVGFAISGCMAKVNRWKHLFIVAIGVWIVGLINIFIVSISFIEWLFGVIFILFIMAIGGGLSYLFAPTPKSGESNAVQSISGDGTATKSEKSPIILIILLISVSLIAAFLLIDYLSDLNSLSYNENYTTNVLENKNASPKIKTDIHAAAILGSVDEIESILAEKPELVNDKDEKGNTPLHLAVSILGNKEAVKLLIARGAYVNAQNNIGATPLHMALTNLGDKEMVEFLVVNGADINSTLKDNGATPLHMAVGHGLKGIVEFLMSKGADINGRDAIGGTALHHLVQEGQEDDTDMIEFLLSKGADINAKEHVMGGTPLHYASMNGYINIVRFLIDKGADITCQGEGGLTALSLAEQEGHKDVADLLRKRMKDVRDLLLAIEEIGYSKKDVLVFTERLKNIAPETNKKLGADLKKEYTFEWYANNMLSLKWAEQMFRALEMSDEADRVSKAVESLELAWSESDLHSILSLRFYNEDIDAQLNAIAEKLSEEERKKLTVDSIPVKALAQKLLEQADPNN
jgi:ankyrin repeat protein